MGEGEEEGRERGEGEEERGEGEGKEGGARPMQMLAPGTLSRTFGAESAVATEIKA